MIRIPILLLCVLNLFFFSLPLRSDELPPMPPVQPGEYLAPPAMGEMHPDVLKIGDEAPDFSLPLLGEGEEVRLSAFRGQPVVLIFGNYSCPVFRGQINAIDALAKKFSGKAKFFLVYIREAHPGSVLYIQQDGEAVLKTIHQTEIFSERVNLALQTKHTLHLKLPILVDRVDNFVNIAYSGWPVRFEVVDADGKIAFKGNPGPWGFWPDRLESWLKQH